MAAYRASVHSSTGFSLNRIILGKEVPSPLDIAMGLPLEEVHLQVNILLLLWNVKPTSLIRMT